MYSEADGADKSSVLAIGVNANKRRILPMGVAIIGFDEVFEAFRELLHFCLY